MKRYDDRKKRRKIRKWRNNPIDFIEEYFENKLLHFQKEMLRKEIEKYKKEGMI